MRKTIKNSNLNAAKRARMLRVNQAGEYGARQIYAGQLAALRWRKADANTIAQVEHMQAQEETHLAAFNKLVAQHQVRPTLLQPLWHVTGFALGALTGLLGDHAAMACTVAVEEVIDAHYAAQHKTLDGDPELQALVEKFREEENEHRETALEQGAELTPLYGLLRKVIHAGSKTAIWLAERV